MKRVLMTIALAIVAFICVIVSDFLLQKIPNKFWLGRLIAIDGVRMGISYFIGITVFLIAIKAFSFMV